MAEDSFRTYRTPLKTGTDNESDPDSENGDFYDLDLTLAIPVYLVIDSNRHVSILHLAILRVDSNRCRWNKTHRHLRQPVDNLT
jgi:hypothetical protein